MAIARKIENDIDMFNFLQPDGTLLSKKWFKKVEPFEDEEPYTAVLNIVTGKLSAK